MQDAIARLVHPIIDYGLDLKDRLDQGETPAIEIEQAALKGMLLSEIESRRHAAFGGEAEAKSAGEARDRSGPLFLGIRYALTCWLDELFIFDSRLAATWNERKLEVAFYGTNDRAWKFWEQARIAEGRGGNDALEVFFLCVMLGFRGEMREEPDQLRVWTAATRAQLARSLGGEWPNSPPELEPASDVPPLEGIDQFRKMTTTAAVLLALMVPIMLVALQRWGGGGAP